MKSLDIPLVITPTLTLPPQQGEGHSKIYGWKLLEYPAHKILDEGAGFFLGQAELHPDEV